MLGAIIGDIVGSRFEWNNYRGKDFSFFSSDCFPTDDTYMTLAVANAILVFIRSMLTHAVCSSNESSCVLQNFLSGCFIHTIHNLNIISAVIFKREVDDTQIHKLNKLFNHCSTELTRANQM